MSDDRPLFPPYLITITWEVGGDVEVAYPDLSDWECAAVLRKALELVTADEDEDEEAEA